jgi:uncharacterized membrane protein
MVDVSVKIVVILFGVFMMLIGVAWINRSWNADVNDKDEDKDEEEDEKDDDHSGLVHVGFGTYRTPEMCFCKALLLLLWV